MASAPAPAPRGEVHSITILNVTAARSCLDITDGGHARWHYEPRTGPATDPAALIAITLHLLGIAPRATSPDAYRAFPLKGAAGRHLQDHGLTVNLHVHQDLESFEAPYDLLAAALDVRPDRLRGIVARWRRAGYAATGTLGPGPAWCWLTHRDRPGLPRQPARPRLA